MLHSFGLLHPVHLSPHSLLQAAATALPACLLPCLTTPSERSGVSLLRDRRDFVTPSLTTRLTHPDPENPIAPSSPSSVYMSMSVTDSYTQSQTRLHNSVTALDTATAHWRRNAANAHLAAVMGPSLRRHCGQSSSYSVSSDVFLVLS